MSHVANSVPATWRGGTIPMLAARLELRARAVRLYRVLSDGPGILTRLRALGAKPLARFHKARSLTQSASAFERFGEDVLTLHAAGVPPHELRRAAVAVSQLVDDCDVRPSSPAVVLGALAVAQQAEAAEDVAEATLLCRADRHLTIGDLDRLIETREAEIAADQEVIAAASRLRRQMLAERHGSASRRPAPSSVTNGNAAGPGGADGGAIRVGTGMPAPTRNLTLRAGAGR